MVPSWATGKGIQSWIPYSKMSYLGPLQEEKGCYSLISYSNWVGSWNLVYRLSGVHECAVLESRLFYLIAAPTALKI